VRRLLLRLRLPLHLRRLPILLLPILCSLLLAKENQLRNSSLLVSHFSSTEPLSSRYFSDASIADFLLCSAAPRTGFRLFSDAPHTGFLRMLRADCLLDSDDRGSEAPPRLGSAGFLLNDAPHTGCLLFIPAPSADGVVVSDAPRTGGLFSEVPLTGDYLLEVRLTGSLHHSTGFLFLCSPAPQVQLLLLLCSVPIRLLSSPGRRGHLRGQGGGVRNRFFSGGCCQHSFVLLKVVLFEALDTLACMGAARPRTEAGAGLGDDARDDRLVLTVVSCQVHGHTLVQHGRDDEVSVLRRVADVKPICNFDGGKLRSSRACNTILNVTLRQG
jgi:hypothetical protein